MKRTLVRYIVALRLDPWRVPSQTSRRGPQSVRSPWRVSCLVALAVGLASFGVMTLFWYLLQQDLSLPGHWDYASGTLGDALVLPLLVGALTYLLCSLPSSARDSVACSIGAVVGLAGGAAVQFSWLADPSPRLNWVLPEPETFSLPGWYHAVFLVLLSGAVGAAYCTALVRLGSTDSEEVVRAARLPVGVFCGAVTAFLFLVVLDSIPSAGTSSSTTTIVLCGASIAAALLPLSLAAHRSLNVLLPAQAIGVAAGLSFNVLVAILWPR